jgi:hypothetical protein
MSKIFAFVKFCAFILGAVGGFGYAVYGGSWPIAAAIIILALMAWPEFENAWKELTN